MNTRRLAMFFITSGLALITVFFLVVSPRSIATSADNAKSDNVVLAQEGADDLPPCGAYKDMRTFQTPEATPVAPTSTPDANAPTPTPPPPTPTFGPAPAEDRVGFPENYETEFKLFFVFDRPDRKLVRAICGNEIAAQHQPGEPFAYGSVLLMISYSAKLDANGQPVLDENGHYIAEKLVALHVQRKEEGFGEAYGPNRAGEWEFVAFNGDGTYQNRPETTNFCAVCHGGEGGASVDYVFRMNLLHDGEAALMSPPVGENEVSIYLYSFHEPVLEVTAGTTVTWVNHDEASHTVVAAEVNEQGKVVVAEERLFQSEVLPSANIEPGRTFSFTFDEPGEYLYMCTVHANEVGRIIVTE